MYKTLSSIALLLHISGSSANVWTVDCGVVTTQRMDPIVYPDHNPAGHVHSVVGASGFRETVSYEDLVASQCTSCNVKVGTRTVIELAL